MSFLEKIVDKCLPLYRAIIRVEEVDWHVFLD
jgi:hypothetical protein